MTNEDAVLLENLAKRLKSGEKYNSIARSFPPPITRAHVWKMINRGWVPAAPHVRIALGLPALVSVAPCPDCGQVHTKGHPHAEPPRPRLIAAVSAEQKRAVSEAAKAAGMTEARWIRIKLGLEE